MKLGMNIMPGHSIFVLHFQPSTILIWWTCELPRWKQH